MDFEKELESVNFAEGENEIEGVHDLDDESCFEGEKNFVNENTDDAVNNCDSVKWLDGTGHWSIPMRFNDKVIKGFCESQSIKVQSDVVSVGLISKRQLEIYNLCYFGI